MISPLLCPSAAGEPELRVDACFPVPDRRFLSGRGGDEYPVREGGYATLACACANENAVRRADPLGCARVDGVDRGDDDVRVPTLHGNGHARDARLNEATPRKPSAKARARREAAAFREVEKARA